LEGTNDELFIIDKNDDLGFSDETDDVTSITGIFGVAAVIVNDRGVNILRTLDGTRPLYYGIKKNLFAFATERKSLWNIDVTSVKRLEPGQGITQPWKGNLVTERFATLERPSRTEASREEILVHLKKSLHESIERLCKDTSCAVLFSGGVDSSLVATLVTERCENTILVTTRADQSHDENAATEAASQLGLPLHTVELNSQKIWDTLPELIHTIETSRQMDVEIALPFYLAAKKAAEKGCTTVISGQGPDELFAGYAKDQTFVQTALSVPIEWKINPKGTPQRKVIFRELAQIMGVPKEIAHIPKSATQYSSGSSKILLESIIEHVDGFSSLSKKKAARRVQDVLDEIASEIQMLHVPDK
jgi:asparagine synthase (glutamine-hydrolysing)